jgi:hypothetical protein
MDDLVRDVDDLFLAVPDHLAREGITAIGSPQDRPAARQDAPYLGPPERDYTSRLKKAVIAVLDPEYFTAIIFYGRLDHSPDDRIQAGSVAPAGKDPNSPHKNLLPRKPDDLLMTINYRVLRNCLNQNRVLLPEICIGGVDINARSSNTRSCTSPGTDLKIDKPHTMPRQALAAR